MHPTTVIGVPAATTANPTQAALVMLYRAMRQVDCIPGLDMLIGAASYLCRTKDLS